MDTPRTVFPKQARAKAVGKSAEEFRRICFLVIGEGMKKKKEECPHGYILDNCIKCIHPPGKRDLSKENRAEILEYLVRARTLLLRYDMFSDWDFGVDCKEWWKACLAVEAALTALDWHRR